MMAGEWHESNYSDGINSQIGQKVIVCTRSIGYWFGVLAHKHGPEIILSSARRLFCWQTIEGVSLSSVAIYGVDEKRSMIEAPVLSVWLLADEIMTMTEEAIASIERTPYATLQDSR